MTIWALEAEEFSGEANLRRVIHRARANYLPSRTNALNPNLLVGPR
ncbi:protein of unknown function [Pararobbsia alpina]